jgi:hypothetical protein
MQLGQLWQLEKRSVQLQACGVVDSLAEEAEIFLTSLAGCRSVHLCLPGSPHVLENALAAVCEAGLPAPAAVVFTVNV